MLKGDARAAIWFGESSMNLLPNFRPTAPDLSACYALTGDLDRGRRMLDTVLTDDPHLSLDKLASPNFPIVNAAHRRIVIEGTRRLGIPPN